VTFLYFRENRLHKKLYFTKEQWRQILIKVKVNLFLSLTTCLRIMSWRRIWEWRYSSTHS